VAVHGAVQMLLAHSASAAQQSAALSQAPPIALQGDVHTSSTQLSESQQSEFVRQEPPVAVQGAVQMLLAHSASAAQQSAALSQAPPIALQGDVHTLSRQVSESQQSEFV
jgi:hypothetical protein